jgi:integrase
MRGSIRQKSKRSWQIQVYTGVDEGGSRRRHFETVRGRKSDAQKRLTELLSCLDKGIYMKPEKTTVKEFLEKWLSEYVKVNVSPRGYERYSGIVYKYLIPEMGGISLQQLKEEHVQNHYASLIDKGLSAGTVQYHHAVIHKALQTAMRWRLIQRNPADGVDVPRKAHTDMQIWDEHEVGRFLEIAGDSPYFALFHTALFTGMRRSELLALRWIDVDFIFCQISVNRSLHQLKDGSYVFDSPKSAKGKRTIALSPSAVSVLQRHRREQERLQTELGKPITDSDPVFCHLDGRPLRPNTVPCVGNAGAQGRY